MPDLRAENGQVKDLFSPASSQGDSTWNSQVLYNGRIWKNLYSTVRGHPFLFSSSFLPGSVTIRGEIFTSLPLKYDIAADEILILSPEGRMLQLNKEMVDSFSFSFNDRVYAFKKIAGAQDKLPAGYIQVVYEGTPILYVKHAKMMSKLGDEGMFDKLYDETRVFLILEGVVYPISGKGDLIRAAGEKKVLVRNYIKKNGLIISNEDPESYKPVLKFLDSLYE
jgi:hypothetical protein